MHGPAHRALLGALLFLILGLVGLAPAALADPAQVATTTSVALTSPDSMSIDIAVSVSVADGSAPDGVLQVAIRSADGTFALDLGQHAVRGGTYRTRYSVPRPGVYEVEGRYSPSNSTDTTTYAASSGTSTVDTRVRAPRLYLKARDLGNGVLEVAGNVSAFNGDKIRGGSFEVRVPGRTPVTLANDRGGLVNAFFEDLPIGRSHTAEVEFRPSAGSGELGVTRRITKELTQERHSSYIGATGSSPRRGVARISAYMYPNYPAGLVGKVAIRDLRTGTVVARIATMRYVEIKPGVVRTLTGVSPGLHRYTATFTPAPQFRSTTMGSVSPVLKIVVR